jgi:excisionase family DNA binding protein
MDDLLTTRQLQDLLQVDRITIYRMLNDGRLRGFKVGGQWRFPLRAIEAWLREHQAGMGPPVIPTRDAETSAPSHSVLPMTCIHAIQAVCAEAMSVAAVTTSLDGEPLGEIGNSCQFCDLILGTAMGHSRCAEAWRQAASGHVQRCHAGLLCIGAQIAVGGRPVAVTAVCQFVTPHPNGADPPWVARLPLLARDLALPEDDLRSAAGTVRTLPESHVARVVALTARIARTFEEIGQERQSLLGRLERIAEMSKV